ncbi:UbiA family prenyltransferase [Longispora albida]|uniref:UbiA family prenyltransferase n=1 Tax=Longispora albida TaxID=203523 RepID=UPI000378086F|nr:UbiA family prenyltransferase [Longispora albida]
MFALRRACRLRVTALLRACHPEPALAVTAGGTLLAAGAGQQWSGVLASGAAILATQLSVGWGNDWLDADRDVTAGRPDKPVAAGHVSRPAIRTAAIAAGLVSLPLALLSGVPAALALLIGLASAWLYNIPLKRTVLSPLPYVVSFAALPAFAYLGLPGAPPPPWWLPVAGGLLGFGAHFANALPDLADDEATGVRSAPLRAGPGLSRVLAAAGLAAASVVLAVGIRSWPGLAVVAAAAVILPAGLWLGSRPGSRAAFRAVLVVALLDVALLVAAPFLSGQT